TSWAMWCRVAQAGGDEPLAEPGARCRDGDSERSTDQHFVADPDVEVLEVSIQGVGFEPAVVSGGESCSVTDSLSGHLGYASTRETTHLLGPGSWSPGPHPAGYPAEPPWAGLCPGWWTLCRESLKMPATRYVPGMRL